MDHQAKKFFAGKVVSKSIKLIPNHPSLELPGLTPTTDSELPVSSDGTKPQRKPLSTMKGSGGIW